MEQELITLGILFAFALVGGIIAARFKQPTLLGLLLVGAAIGPNALGLVKNTSIISMMIDFGAILMLFVIGLEFDLTKLQKIGMKAIIVGLLKSAIVVFTGFIVGLLLGLGVQTSLFIGIILAFSSTVVIVKVLEQREMMSRQEVPLLIAVLIIEDLLAVVILTFFSGITDKSSGIIGSIQNLVISMCILVVVYVLFVKLIKPVLAWILKTTKGEEITIFTALAMCAGFSYLAYVLKLSPAAGAFLAGSIVASLPDAKNFEKAISPYNVMISSFFFIAVGTLISFTSIKQNLIIIGILVLTVILTRLLAFGTIVYLFANFKGDKMFFSSMAMFSVGEFALLIAQESTKFSTGLDLMSISAAIIFITAIIMSMTLNFSDKIYEPTKDNLPYKFRKKMEKFADYIKSISEELDLDNKHSRGLKKNFFATFNALIAALLVVFGWRKLSTVLVSNGLLTWTYIGYYATYAIITVLLFYMLFKLHKVIISLGDVFSNATNNRNIMHSRIVVRRAFLGFSMVGLGLVWPFAMFVLNISPLWILASFGLLSVAVWQFHKISQGMEDNIDLLKDRFPVYAKFDYENNPDKVNEGWEI